MNYILTHGKREFEIRRVSRALQPFSTWEVYHKGEKIDGVLHPPTPAMCDGALARFKDGGKWFYNPMGYSFNNRRSVPARRRCKGGRPKKMK